MFTCTFSVLDLNMSEADDRITTTIDGRDESSLIFQIEDLTNPPTLPPPAPPPPFHMKDYNTAAESKPRWCCYSTFERPPTPIPNRLLSTSFSGESVSYCCFKAGDSFIQSVPGFGREDYPQLLPSPLLPKLNSTVELLTDQMKGTHLTQPSALGLIPENNSNDSNNWMVEQSHSWQGLVPSQKYPS